MDFHLKVIELREQGLGLREIAKLLHKCTDTIREELVLSGHMTVEKRKGGRKRKYSIDDEFFKVLDNEEKAYILGFILADGCIHEKRNQLSITLDSKDERMLDTISCCLHSNFPIVKYFARYDDKHRLTEKRKFQITSTQILTDLNKLGCVARKSDILKFPIIPKLLMHHFMRGYFDGDGTVFISGRGDIHFGIISTFEFCDEYLKQLPYDGKARVQKEQRSQKNVHYFSITGKAVHKIYNFLYKDATIYLERKKQIFVNYFEK